MLTVHNSIREVLLASWRALNDVCCAAWQADPPHDSPSTLTSQQRSHAAWSRLSTSLPASPQWYQRLGTPGGQRLPSLVY